MIVELHTNLLTNDLAATVCQRVASKFKPVISGKKRFSKDSWVHWPDAMVCVLFHVLLKRHDIVFRMTILFGLNSEGQASLQAHYGPFEFPFELLPVFVSLFGVAR